jgi:DNA invertase Pin-like site-specific DNA recombinase
MWRLDRWGRPVADPLATLQELNNLGVGVVSPTEAPGLTTPAGRAMAGLPAVFAEFEREILRKRSDFSARLSARFPLPWQSEEPHE